ncbi:MAG: hypothetical protein KAI22_03050 [Gammaproteobacteria bacterium]|nr:hypothetical protein [Gammaproteobacteria bacterium]
MDDLFDIPKLLKLRKSTNIISSYLEQELKSHITTLSPLFHPKLVFGEYINGSKQNVKGSDVTFKQLQKVYKSLTQTKLFYDRLEELKPPMDVFASVLELNPYEYDYQASSDGESKTIRIISPVKWVLGYKNQGITQLKELLSDRMSSANSYVQICVLHHLVINSVCSKRDDVLKLLAALRFNISTESSAEYGNIPLVVVSCPVRTIRPSDELIIQSTELSGASIFEEVINEDDINQLIDPYKEHLLELLNGSS